MLTQEEYMASRRVSVLPARRSSSTKYSLGGSSDIRRPVAPTTVVWSEGCRPRQERGHAEMAHQHVEVRAGGELGSITVLVDDAQEAQVVVGSSPELVPVPRQDLDQIVGPQVEHLRAGQALAAAAQDDDRKGVLVAFQCGVSAGFDIEKLDVALEVFVVEQDLEGEVRQLLVGVDVVVADLDVAPLER